MLSIVWSGRPAVGFAACALLAVSACAPNSVRTPLDTGSMAETQAEKEEGRYGTLLRMASSTRENGDPAAAIQMYRQAISVEPDRPEAYVLMGETLNELEAYQEALRTFEEAITKDTESAAAHRGYGRALVALNRPESAIGHYDTATKLAPDDLRSWNGLGVAYDLAGDHASAATAYAQGLEIAPDSMLLRNNLGLSLALSGRHDEGIELLRQVVDEPGARARYRQNLALAYGLKGDMSAAERVSRVDLANDDVENNLAYYASMRAVDDRRARATAVGVQSPDRSDPADQDHANRRLAAIAGAGFELGGGSTGRWFLNLGDYASASGASAAWRDLKSEYGPLLGSYTRLASAESGEQPLLVGPIGDAARAQDLCGRLKSHGQDCSAVPL